MVFQGLIVERTAVQGLGIQEMFVQELFVLRFCCSINSFQELFVQGMFNVQEMFNGCSMFKKCSRIGGSMTSCTVQGMVVQERVAPESIFQEVVVQGTVV